MNYKIFGFFLNFSLIAYCLQIYSEEHKPITVAILAKDKAHTLPLYLSCLEKQTWPKSKTFLYIRTNNNTDHTAQVLKEWLNKVGHLYAGIQFDDSDTQEQVQNYKQHEWNSLRFKVLGKIRKDSIEWAKSQNSNYMVIDCDNFIKPHTIEALVNTNLPIVAPFLKINDNCAYSNYHLFIDENGYLENNPLNYFIFTRELNGLIKVPVVHCTYFIQHQYLGEMEYDDDSERHEYVVFSDTARKKGIAQYLDNREEYGYITFAENIEELNNETWIHEFQDENDVLQATFTYLYDHCIWSKNEAGKCTSGEGSSVANTLVYRAFLQLFLETLSIKSVVDAGCGDWEFSQLINWSGIDYKGYDIVKRVIEENIQKFSNHSIQFFHENFLVSDLPPADLIIIKDVFQHLSNTSILSFLPQLTKYKYCLLINDIANTGFNQNDVPVGLINYRILDLTKPPFNLQGKSIFTFQSGLVNKEVFLIKN